MHKERLSGRRFGMIVALLALILALVPIAGGAAHAASDPDYLVLNPENE